MINLYLSIWVTDNCFVALKSASFLEMERKKKKNLGTHLFLNCFFILKKTMNLVLIYYNYKDYYTIKYDFQTDCYKNE